MARRAQVQVLVATPLGKHGRGGIDRLNDSIFEAVMATPDLGVRTTQLVTRGKLGLAGAPLVFAGALSGLLARAVFGRVDVLHIHLAIRGSAIRKTIIAAAARMLRIPYVVHLHGFDFDEFWLGAGPYLARALDLMFLGSGRIVVMGRHWAKVITDRLPGIADRIVLLPNATPDPAPLREHPRPDPSVHIVFLGQLGARKGTDVLLDALAGLPQGHGWRATIAGDGEVEATRAAVRNGSIAARVIIPGWLDVQAREALFATTDILVLPSTAENQPMVIIEAMARSIPVVSTPVGAIPEVIDSERNGLLVPIADAAALAAALARLIADADLRKRLGRAARRDYEERYEFSGYVARLCGVWRDLAK